MKTNFDSINYIIKKLVEYQIKQWCSDVHYDRTMKLLPLHALSIAKHVATDIGYDIRYEHSRIKTVTAHMRPYCNIAELNEKAAHDIPFIIEDWEHNNPSTDFMKRYVMEDGEKVVKFVGSNYFDEYGRDSIILFLMEHEYNPLRDGKVDKIRFDEDERIVSGRCIAAVEVKPSIYGCKFLKNDGTDDIDENSTWEVFRKRFGDLIKDGRSESSAYKETVLDECVAWNISCCDTVVALFQQYALNNLNDRHFMNTLVHGLPEFAVFKNADDFELYDENMKKVKNFKQTLEWPTMVKL